MSSPKASSWTPSASASPSSAGARWLAALVLHRASVLLARWAQEVAKPRRAAQSLTDPRLEFHAEAGAPEGAIYLDGQLYGWLPGVQRL
jgi:hypothetical protein